MHEVPVTLIVGSGQAAVLVQIHGGDFGEVQIADLVPVLDQALVGADRRTASGKTQYTVRLCDNLSSDDVRSLAGHFRIVLCFDDSHGNYLLPFSSCMIILMDHLESVPYTSIWVSAGNGEGSSALIKLPSFSQVMPLRVISNL